MKSYSSREIIKLINTVGWFLVRVEGSYHIFKHEVKNGVLTVPHPKKDLPKKTAEKILKRAGVTFD